MLTDTIRSKVRDESGKLVDPDDFEAALTEALKRYSKHRPLWLVRDIVGNAGHDYALPAEWSDGLSAIQGIEYPIGNVPETLLASSEYKLYATPTGKKLRLLEITPPVTASFRLAFTALHASEATVPAADLEAVANLAASVCCRQLAQIYGQTSDPTIGADVVNYRSKSGEFTSLANKLETLYKEHLGLKDEDTTPAAMAVAAPPESSRVRLTHRRRI